MKNVNEINKIIDFFGNFIINYDQYHNMSIGTTSINEYPNQLKTNIEIFSVQIKEIFDFVDKVMQHRLINDIKNKLDTLTGAEFDKNQYINEVDNSCEIENGEKIFPSNQYNPIENYPACMCYDKYIESIVKLKDSFTRLLEIGGYKIYRGKLIGPLDSSKISLKRIESKLNVDELGYFLNLLIEAKIFDGEKTDIADMISKNFITQQQKKEHFTYKSIYNKIKADVAPTYKNQVLKELISIIKNNLEFLNVDNQALIMRLSTQIRNLTNPK